MRQVRHRGVGEGDVLRLSAGCWLRDSRSRPVLRAQRGVERVPSSLSFVQSQPCDADFPIECDLRCLSGCRCLALMFCFLLAEISLGRLGSAITADVTPNQLKQVQERVLIAISRCVYHVAKVQCSCAIELNKGDL